MLRSRLHLPVLSDPSAETNWTVRSILLSFSVEKGKGKGKGKGKVKVRKRAIVTDVKRDKDKDTEHGERGSHKYIYEYTVQRVV